MIGTLHISHKLFDWKNSNGLTFLNRSNLNKIIKDPKTIDCFTSIEDLHLKIQEIGWLVNQCKIVNIVGTDGDFLSRIESENLSIYCGLLVYLSKNPHKCLGTPWKNILSFEQFNDHKSTRSSLDKTLWVNGCSFSEGFGIPSYQRYGNLLAQRLQLPLVMLAEKGSSISWQADQWLRADLQPGDVAIWGLTSIGRENYVDGQGQWKNFTIGEYSKISNAYRYWNIDYFDSMTQAVSCIKKILQVENYFCKIGVDYYFINLIDVTYLPLAFLSHQRFLNLAVDVDRDLSIDKNSKINELYQHFLDFASDGLHPGPNQHQKYCNDIYDFIVKHH